MQNTVFAQAREVSSQEDEVLKEEPMEESNISHTESIKEEKEE